MATGVQVWSQTAATNATADGNVNYAEGQAPSSLNDSSRAAMSSVAKWRDDLSGTNVTAGTSSAFTLVTNQVATALTSGYTVSFIFSKPCAAGATLAVDGLTAKPLQVIPGTNVQVSEYTSGVVGSFTYSSTGSGQWIANTPPVNPPAAPSAMFPVFTTLTNSLSVDATMNTTGVFVDGPSVSQGSSGTWFVSGSVSLVCASQLMNYVAKLWDGTTVIDAAQVFAPNAAGAVAVALSGVITSPAGNLKISASIFNNAVSQIKATSSVIATTNVSTITAVRIG